MEVHNQRRMQEEEMESSQADFLKSVLDSVSV